LICVMAIHVRAEDNAFQRGLLAGNLLACERSMGNIVAIGGMAMVYSGNDPAKLMQKQAAVNSADEALAAIWRCSQRLGDDFPESNKIAAASSINSGYITAYSLIRKEEGLSHSDESLAELAESALKRYGETDNALGISIQSGNDAQQNDAQDAAADGAGDACACAR